MNETASNRNGETPMESWKEIGAYLQRDTTTARRWEKEEGLPVHRHNHKARSSVYAYPSEIDAWRASRKVIAEPPPPVPLWRGLFAPPRALAFGVTMLACLIMVGNGIRPVSAQQVRGSGTLTKRLLCGAECRDNGVGFSRDGRLNVFTDSQSGDLAIRDMSTGKVKRLMAKTGTYKDSDLSARPAFFSPDLRQIVYWWGDTHDVHTHQLRVMPNQPGATPRVLVDNPENLEYTPQGWFPDGKSVLVMVSKHNFTSQLARVSVSDGAVTVLKSLDWRVSLTVPGWPGVSPDGQYIVYAALAINPLKYVYAPPGERGTHIYVLAADGSSENEIVKTAGINVGPVWTPDGKHILFTSDRSGKFDLWSIAVQNGKPVGSASLVSPEIGRVTSASMHGSSYYYYANGLEAEYVNIVELAAGGSSKETRVARATESFVGIRPTWSPDGRSIGFKRHHPGSVNDYDLVVHSLDTGDERTYLTKFGTSGPGRPYWSHDGKTIITGIGPSDTSRSFYRIDLMTGEFKAVPVIGLPPFAFSPDDRTVYAARNDEKDWATLPAHILSVDLTSGAEKEIFTMPEPGYANLLLTPDGRTLVIWRRLDQKTRMSQIARLNVDGTGYREIYAITEKDFRGNNFTLTQDGRWILLAKRHDDNWQLIRVPVEGGVPESTGMVLDATLYPNSIDLSPDGSRIAFTTVKHVEELWSLDNVLSALK